MFAITKTFDGAHCYTWPVRFASTEEARASITPRFAQGQSLSITVDGLDFVPLDLDIKLTTTDTGAVTIYSRAHRCEFTVHADQVKKNLCALIKEHREILEAA